MDSVFNHCLFTFVCNVLQAHGVSFQTSPKYCNYYYYFPIFVVAVIVMTLPVINVMAR